MAKIKKALDLVEKALAEYDRPFVSSSFGKDSLVVTDLVHRVDPSVPVVFADTGVNHPSAYKTYLYYRERKKIIRAKRVKTFWEVIEEYGWPIGARDTSSNRAVNYCCKYLKKDPMAEATEGYDLEFNGMTAYESWTRYCQIEGYGVYKFVKSRGKNGRQVCLPIGHWRAGDVWDYIEERDLEYPAVYDQPVDKFTKRGKTKIYKGVEMDDQIIRLGCWTCPLPIKNTAGVMKQLRTYYPQLWETLMQKGLAREIAERKLGGQGSLFDGFFSKDKENYWLENRPCFFDKI